MDRLDLPALRGAIRATLCVLTLGLGSAGMAQLLAEVATVAAVSAQLDPALRLPSGSQRVLGGVPPQLLARVRGANEYRDWEAYAATGLAARLFPAHRHQLANSFALAGYFEQSRDETRHGREKHTSHLFTGSDGGSVLLYVIETDDELVWLIGRRD